MNSLAKSHDDRIFPNKVQLPHHQVVTETIYSTQVVQQEGATTTLVVENCVPINSHIPFCGNIYPIHQVPELPINYFHVPMPVLHGKFPVEYKPNYIQTAGSPLNAFNEFPHEPLLSVFNPNVPPLKAPPQKFPPTSHLQSHVPGFINRLANMRLSLSSAALNGFDKVSQVASQASHNAANLANSVHSHLHDLHQHKMNFIGRIDHTELESPQEDILGSASELVESTSNEVKPVREEQMDDFPPPAVNAQPFLKTENNLSVLKSLIPADKQVVDLEQKLINSPTNVSNSTDKDNCLNDAIVKKLNEITLSENIANHMETTEMKEAKSIQDDVQQVERITNTVAQTLKRVV